MTKTIRIGSAGGFTGDTSVSAPQLIEGGNLDYLVLDYLAEVTMSLLARSMAKRPDAGYLRDFTDWIWKDNLEQIAARGVKIVTNAGGINPKACRARMEEIADAAGIKLKIAIVEGDNFKAKYDHFAAGGYKEMFSDAPLPKQDAVMSANAYLGAFPIAEALQAGADVVITGRVVDSALTLGPLIHEFGWTPKDFDLLAAGSLAGHLLECGAQATGGLFTDWEDVPDWAHIGYPIAECEADGTFVMTKPDGTGGLCSFGTVTEQIVYEIGDPQAYLLPDVVCDFSEVNVEEIGKDRVRVSGTKGYAPTSTYKGCITYQDGYRVISVMPIVGMDAARKVHRQADAVFERCEELFRAKNLPPFRAKRVEALGAEATYGAHARTQNSREVVGKIAVEHDDKEALEIYMREMEAPATSMSVGTTGWFGSRPAIAPVVRICSIGVPKQETNAIVDLDGKRWEVEAANPGWFDNAMVTRPAIEENAPTDEPRIPVRLVDIAWARSGDKGDKFNIGVIARKPEYLPYIRAALTADRVKDFLAHEFEDAKNPRVERFDLPGFNAVNFLCHESLGGGQMATLRMDALAKGKGQQLLEIEISIPRRLADKAGINQAA